MKTNLLRIWGSIGLLIFMASLMGACGGDGGGGTLGAPVKIYANRVLDYSPVNSLGASSADWPYFYQPGAILGEVGDFTNVISLGYDPADTGAQGGTITVGLGLASGSTDAKCVVDGPGADFVVFENPFRTGDIGDGSPGTYNEVATVEVSADGAQWYQFPTTIDGAKALEDPARYTNFAGVLPVDEGGDPFDLTQVIEDNPGVLDANFQACFIRIGDGGMAFADYGNSQSDLYNSGADINAIEAIHFETVAGLSQ